MSAWLRQGRRRKGCMKIQFGSYRFCPCVGVLRTRSAWRSALLRPAAGRSPCVLAADRQPTGRDARRGGSLSGRAAVVRDRQRNRSAIDARSVRVGAKGVRVGARSVRVEARGVRVEARSVRAGARGVRAEARGVRVGARSVRAGARGVPVGARGVRVEARAV